LTKDSKQAAQAADPAQGAAVAAKKAEKVRSSRYEWEGSFGEKENAAPSKKAARGSLMGSLGAWVKKLFSLNFFDKDDDATPSTA
jgi:hypothetical protein